MSLVKTAQYDQNNLDISDFIDVIDIEEDPETETPEDDFVIEIDEDGNDQNEPEEIISFKLPNVPGGVVQDDLADIIVDDPEEDDDITVEERDKWDWGGTKNFMKWLHGMMNGVPKHSGYETAGLERAIAFLQGLDRAISKAVRTDLKDELDIAKIEEARDEIIKGIDRLEERLERVNTNKRKSKKKKAGEEQEGLVKEAQKITGVRGVMVTVPLLISRLARICINGSVSAGHDIEQIFDSLSKKYELTKREEAELLQLLEDMGYPIRRDRGFDRDEDIDTTKCDNYDWSANYPA